MSLTSYTVIENTYETSKVNYDLTLYDTYFYFYPALSPNIIEENIKTKERNNITQSMIRQSVFSDRTIYRFEKYRVILYVDAIIVVENDDHIIPLPHCFFEIKAQIYHIGALVSNKKILI